MGLFSDYCLYLAEVRRLVHHVDCFLKVKVARYEGLFVKYGLNIEDVQNPRHHLSQIVHELTS